MPNKAAAKKALKQSKKLMDKNNAEKKLIKDLAKKILKAVQASQADKISELSKKFQQAVDKAVKHGWLKKNSGVRKKSRLSAAIKKKLKK